MCHFGDDFGLFWPVQPAIEVGEPLYDLGIPSRALTGCVLFLSERGRKITG